MRKTLLTLIGITLGMTVTGVAATYVSENFDYGSTYNYTDNQTLAGTGTSTSGSYNTVNSNYGTTGFYYVGGGTVATSTSEFLSGTRSLALSSDTGGTNQSQVKFTLGTASGTATSVTSALDVQLAFKIGTLGNSSTVVVRNSGGTNAALINVGSSNSVTAYFGGSGLSLYTSAQGFTANTWYYLNLSMTDISTGGTQYTAKVTDTSGNLLGTQQTGNFFTSISSNLNYRTLEIYDTNVGSSTVSYNYFDNVLVQTASVPEPSTWMTLGIIGFIIFSTRSRKNVLV